MSEAPDIFLSYSRDDQVTAWRAAERSGRRGSIQARELIELPGSRHSSPAGRGPKPVVDPKSRAIARRQAAPGQEASFLGSQEFAG